MLNIIYLILLSDINLWLGIIGICALPYYIKINHIRLDLSPFAVIFLFGVTLTLLFSLRSGFVGLNLLCILLYTFKYSFYDYRPSLAPSFVIYLLSLLVLLQINYPAEVETLFSFVRDGRVEVLDYSSESISNIRYSGIFTNPNYFALVIILLYSIELIRFQENFSKFLNICVIFCVVSSGSRAALGSLVIVILYSFIYINSSRNYILFLVVMTAVVLGFFSITFDLRVFQFQGILTNSDPSSTARISTLIQYFDDIWGAGDYLSLFFGKGRSDPYVYFFDGDVGNIFYLIGLFGSLSFMMLIMKRYKSGQLQLLILGLFPFILAGGLFGNLKTLFIFAFLPDILRTYSAFYPIVPNRFN